MKTTWLATLLILLLSVQWVDAHMDAYAKHPAQPDILLSADEALEQSGTTTHDDPVHHCCHCHGLNTLFTPASAPDASLLAASARLFPAAGEPVALRVSPPEHRPPIA